MRIAHGFWAWSNKMAPRCTCMLWSSPKFVRSCRIVFSLFMRFVSDHSFYAKRPCTYVIGSCACVHTTINLSSSNVLFPFTISMTLVSYHSFHDKCECTVLCSCAPVHSMINLKMCMGRACGALGPIFLTDRHAHKHQCLWSCFHIKQYLPSFWGRKRGQIWCRDT